MEKISKKLVLLMRSNGLLDKDDIDYYVYVIQILIEKIIGYSAILIIGIILNVFWISLFFITFFSCLRKFTNGFHMASFKTCFITSIGIYIFIVSLIEKIFIDRKNSCFVILLCATIVILCVGAVNNSNINWTYSEEKNNKFAARIIVLIENGIIIGADYLEINRGYTAYMIFGLALCAMLLIIEKIRKGGCKT